MAAPEQCISCFFQEDSTAMNLDKTLDSSQDSGQHSLHNADLLSLSQVTVQEQESIKIGSKMAAPEQCISCFFQEDSTAMNLDKTLDSSQDSGQHSLHNADLLSLPQVTVQEQESIKIHPFYNITSRDMPLSPHSIIEEEFSANPWALLIATIFLTKTSGKAARPHMKKFFEEYPTPYHVLNDTPTALERFFDTLGLRKRGHTIWKMSYQFVSSKWRRASDLYGIGKYGEDAYRIFCLGHTDLDPGDRYLKLYLNWLRQTEFIEDNAVVDSECVIEDPTMKYYRITLRDVD